MLIHTPKSDRFGQGRLAVGHRGSAAGRPHRAPIGVRDERDVPAPVVVAARTVSDAVLHKAVGIARRDRCVLHVITPARSGAAALLTIPPGWAGPGGVNGPRSTSALERLLADLRREGVHVEHHRGSSLRLRRHAREVATTVTGRLVA